MENTNKNNRTQWLHLRLTEAEYQVIKNNFTQTTNRKLSDYARKMLLKKPMIGSYRDQTMEDLMSILVGLKNELNSIGNNYNQAVKKLHSLQQIADYKPWILQQEKDKEKLFLQMDFIKDCITKIAEKWLQ